MPAPSKLREFLIDEVQRHPADLVPRAASSFGVSRQAVHRHLTRLLGEGLILAVGRTRARRYDLAVLSEITERVEREGSRGAGALWRRRFLPALAGIPANVVEISRFGFAEVARNALDHSGSREISARLRRTAAAVEIRVSDQGTGIFPRLAAVEVATGRSLALVARAFDTFLVWSDRSVLRRERQEDGERWSFDALPARVRGTTVGMRIRVRSDATIESILSPARTVIPLRLAFDEAEQPTSREQARRVFEPGEHSGEVVVDFTGVACVGPAFA